MARRRKIDSERKAFINSCIYFVDRIHPGDLD